MNLLQETIQAITEAGKAISDVRFVGDIDGTRGCNWAEFEELADFDYDNGYKAFPEISASLVVLLNGGVWLERESWDGAERWVSRKRPRLPRRFGALTRAFIRIGARLSTGEWLTLP